MFEKKERIIIAKIIYSNIVHFKNKTYKNAEIKSITVFEKKISKKNKTENLVFKRRHI